MCFRPPQVGKPIRCVECGAMNPFDRTTCKKCKAELPKGLDMLICPQCGAKNLPDSDVCDECGLTVGEVQNDMIQAPGAPKAPVAPKAPGAPVPPSAPKAPGN